MKFSFQPRRYPFITGNTIVIITKNITTTATIIIYCLSQKVLQSNKRRDSGKTMKEAGELERSCFLVCYFVCWLLSFALVFTGFTLPTCITFLSFFLFFFALVFYVCMFVLFLFLVVVFFIVIYCVLSLELSFSCPPIWLFYDDIKTRPTAFIQLEV